MKQTHTYVYMDVSPETFGEIETILKDAGYLHAFTGDFIDMSGIAIKRKDPTNGEECTSENGRTKISAVRRAEKETGNSEENSGSTRGTKEAEVARNKGLDKGSAT